MVAQTLQVTGNLRLEVVDGGTPPTGEQLFPLPFVSDKSWWDVSPSKGEFENEKIGEAFAEALVWYIRHGARALPDNWQFEILAAQAKHLSDPLQAQVIEAFLIELGHETIFSLCQTKGK